MHARDTWGVQKNVSTLEVFSMQFWITAMQYLKASMKLSRAAMHFSMHFLRAPIHKKYLRSKTDSKPAINEGTHAKM